MDWEGVFQQAGFQEDTILPLMYEVKKIYTRRQSNEEHDHLNKPARLQLRHSTRPELYRQDQETKTEASPGYSKQEA